MHVLLTQISPLLLQMMQDQLQALEFELTIAHSLSQAVELYSQYNPDTVLIEVTHPFTSLEKHIEAIHALNEKPAYTQSKLLMKEILAKINAPASYTDGLMHLDIEPWTPIVAITPPLNDAMLQEGLDVGLDDFIFTPLSRSIFQAKMNAMARLTEMQNELFCFAKNLTALNTKLDHLAKNDPLTHIPNRFAFEQVADKEIQISKRNRDHLSLMMIDIDHFKPYNDTFGHLAGDQCLIKVAHAIQQSAKRPGDLVARFGGEEFVILLPHTNASQAEQVIENMMDNVRALEIDSAMPQQAPFLTVSVGLCATQDTHCKSLDHLIACADEALYESKEKGRNCYTIRRLHS